MFAYGLHQEIKAGPQVPFFLAEMRKRVFALVYAHDKEISTFTGRPCRISRKFCVLQLPLDVDDKSFYMSDDDLKAYLQNLDQEGWNTGGEFRSTCWARLRTQSSIVRESILELVLGSDNTNLPERIE